MLDDTSSAAAGITPTVEVAAAMCAALIVEPIFAKSVAATVINSGAAVTNDISFPSTGPHRSIGTARRGAAKTIARTVTYPMAFARTGPTSTASFARCSPAGQTLSL